MILKKLRQNLMKKYDIIPVRKFKNGIPYTVYKKRIKIKDIKRQIPMTAAIPINKVLNGLFETNDLKGCAMFGAENWNALKNTVANVTADALNGRIYVVPTVISCPQSMADELMGFNDIYARSLGENFYNNTWPVIKSNSAALLGANPLEWIQDNIFDSKVGNIVKQGTHIASNVLSKTPIGGWVNIGRDTNDWMSNIWDSLVGKKKSEEETPTAVKAGGGLLVVAGLGVGAYFLLRKPKKNRG